MANLPCAVCRATLGDAGQRFCGTCGGPGPGILPIWMQLLSDHLYEGGSAQPPPALFEALAAARYDASAASHQAALLTLCTRRTSAVPPGVVMSWFPEGRSLGMSLLGDATCLGGQLLLWQAGGRGLVELSIPQLAPRALASMEVVNLDGTLVEGLLRLKLPLAPGATVFFHWGLKFSPSMSGKLSLAPLSRQDAARWLLVRDRTGQHLFGPSRPQAAPAGLLQLTATGGPRPAELWVLPGGEARYGRDGSRVDVTLSTLPPERVGAISSHHLTVRLKQGSVTVQDTHSSNGTTLDGVPLPPGTEVPLGRGRQRLGVANVLQLESEVLAGGTDADGILLGPVGGPPVQYLQLQGTVGISDTLPVQARPLKEAPVALVGLPGGEVGLVNLGTRSLWTGATLVAPGAARRLTRGRLEFGAG